YGYTRMLLGGDIPPEQSRHTLSRIVDLVGNTTALVGGLLDFRRIESGDSSLEVSPIEPLPAIERAVHDMVLSAGTHRVRLEGDTPRIVANEPLFYQIVCNLLSNAVKYSPDG